MSDCFVIALDGPSGAGKSTTARAVAAELGYHYVDSGALYRCVGLAALGRGVALDDEPELARLVTTLEVEPFDDGRRFRLNGDDVTDAIRSAEATQAASKTSALPAVRAALVDWQRRTARAPGLVIEGRDIGTVIFPEANLKVFLDADPDERARRRAAEMNEKTDDVSVGEVGRQLAERDRRDSTRKAAPLCPAADAVMIDSTELGLQDVVARIVALARERQAAV